MVYFFRHVLHDWSDEVCVQILRQVAQAMDPVKSRLLITEMVVPNKDAGIYLAELDYAMMCLGGIERTEEDWRKVLAESGFGLKKIHSVKGEYYSVLEARLAEVKQNGVH